MNECMRLLFYFSLNEKYTKTTCSAPARFVCICDGCWADFVCISWTYEDFIQARVSVYVAMCVCVYFREANRGQRVARTLISLNYQFIFSQVGGASQKTMNRHSWWQLLPALFLSPTRTSREADGETENQSVGRQWDRYCRQVDRWR